MKMLLVVLLALHEMTGSRTGTFLIHFLIIFCMYKGNKSAKTLSIDNAMHNAMM